MKAFPLPLHDGVLLRRYKRFLADIRFADGAVRTVHCANPGAMTGLAEKGQRVLVSFRDDPKRKLAWSWELVKVGRIWVAVNTQIANRVVGAWLRAGRLLPGYEEVRAEVRFGASRFDFLLDGRCVVEVKSVTLADGRMAAFPDAVTLRGRKHVEELRRARRAGLRAVLLYFVPRADVDAVRAAEEIDPQYAAALRAAAADGVEICAISVRMTRAGAALGPNLEVIL